MSKDQPPPPSNRSDHNQFINAKGNVHATGGNHRETQQNATSGNTLQQSGRDIIINNETNFEFLTVKVNGKFSLKPLFCNKLVATVLLTIVLTLLPYQNTSQEEDYLQDKQDVPLNGSTSLDFWLSYPNNDQFSKSSKSDPRPWKGNDLPKGDQEQLNIDLFNPFSPLRVFDDELQQLEEEQEGSYSISSGLFPSRHQGKGYALFAAPDSMFMEIPEYGYFPRFPYTSGSNNDASSQKLEQSDVTAENLQTSVPRPGQTTDANGELSTTPSTTGAETASSSTPNTVQTSDASTTEDLHSPISGSEGSAGDQLAAGDSVQKNKELLLDLLITAPTEIHPSEDTAEEDLISPNNSESVPEPQTILGLILSALLFSNLVKKE